MKHTKEQCNEVHCRCMQQDCTNFHYADHILENGRTPMELRQETVLEKPVLTSEDLEKIRDRLMAYNHVILTQRFPTGMDISLIRAVDNYLVIKSKETDALIAKIYDILNPKS